MVRKKRHVCPYCSGPRICSPRAFAENPFCAACLHERVAAAQKEAASTYLRCHLCEEPLHGLTALDAAELGCFEDGTTLLSDGTRGHGWKIAHASCERQRVHEALAKDSSPKP